MIWKTDYNQRLRDWTDIRCQSRDLALPDALLAINDWWFKSPWKPYTMHWDDWQTWPDPWDLLAEPSFCDLARALGMLYTIHLSEIASTVAIAQTSDTHLVLVDEGKYVLNWTEGSLLNISSQKINIHKTLTSVQMPQLTG